MLNAVHALQNKIAPRDFAGKVIKRLNPTFLDEDWLLSCLRFAKSYHISEFVDFTQTVRFGHIKLLLDVKNKQTRAHYASVAFERGLTPKQLSELIEEEENLQITLVNHPKTVLETNTIISKHGNKNVIKYTHSIEQKEASYSDMNSKFFTDLDVMSFLKDA